MRLPAEWEPQAYVLFAFPNRAGDWGEQLDAASRAMVNAANLVNRVTPVVLIVGDAAHFAAYADDYEGQTLLLPTNDSWVRDFGPLTIFRDGRRIALGFTFNGWGGKFAAALDNAIPGRLATTLLNEVYYQEPDFELEGGSIESDGAGTVLTTTTCLLNPNRNGGQATTPSVELALRNYLGASRILWLSEGELLGDDTDAHVDTLARFLDKTTIAYVRCSDQSDAHYGSLRRMEQQLKELRQADGQAYNLLPLPWCPPVYSDDDGHRLPATYANFLISNGTLFLPTYFDGSTNHAGQAADATAVTTLEKYGKYSVVPVPCRPFIEQHGSLHCLTMQIPAAPAVPAE